jgi:hypothetical protein
LNVIIRWTTNGELVFFTTRGRDELFQQFLQFPIPESFQTDEDLEVVNTFTPGPADPFGNRSITSTTLKRAAAK